MGEARRMLVLVNLASIHADEALLPAVHREVGEALHATPTGLGALTLCHSFVQAPCYPHGAYAAGCYARARVVALGAVPWAATAFLVGRHRLQKLHPESSNEWLTKMVHKQVRERGGVKEKNEGM